MVYAQLTMTNLGRRRALNLWRKLTLARLEGLCAGLRHVAREADVSFPEDDMEAVLDSLACAVEARWALAVRALGEAEDLPCLGTPTCAPSPVSVRHRQMGLPDPIRFPFEGLALARDS